MSFCPACGNPVAEAADVRFCARCGRDLTVPAVPAQAPAPASGQPPKPPQEPQEPTASPGPTAGQAPARSAGPYPPLPPQGPPPTVLVELGRPPGPPPYVPAPGPSPAALFLRRVVVGRWEWPALVTAIPALCLLAVALLMGVWSGAELPSDTAGLGLRTRGALAIVVQGLGGSLRFTEHFTVLESSLGSAFDASGDSPATTAHTTVSILPWTVTLLWVAVLVVGLRVLRRRQADQGAASARAGAETAVRVAVAAALAALVLALVGQPTVDRTHLSTAPAQVVLCTFALTLVTALLVLCRPALDAWLAARPPLATGFRALGTAVLALLLTLFVAGVVVLLIAAAHWDEITGWGVAAAVVMLLDLGVSGLGLAWGAPFHISETGYSGRTDDISFGLSDLGHVWGGGSVTAVVLGGIGCALAIGVLAAWRSRDRVEMYAVAGLFTVLFVVLAAVSGASIGGDGGGVPVAYGATHASLGTSVPEALAFGLLWSLAGVVVGPYLVRRVPPPRVAYGAGRGVPSPYGAPPQGPPTAGPGVPPAAPPGPPAAPAEPTVHDLGVVEPDRPRKDPPSHR